MAQAVLTLLSPLPPAFDSKRQAQRGQQPALPPHQPPPTAYWAAQHPNLREGLTPRRRPRWHCLQFLIERVTLGDAGIEITRRAAGWPTLASEIRPGSIGAELLELEQQEALL